MATSSPRVRVRASRGGHRRGVPRDRASGRPPTGAKRRVASTIVPRASADAPPVPAVDIPHTNDEWEAVSPVDFAADVSAALAADKVVILGKRGALRSPGFVASLPESLRTMWLEAVAAVQAGDNGGKRSIMVPWEGHGGSLKDVVVGVLPTAVSRHNCPAAAFAVDVVLAGVHPPAHGQTLGIITALKDATSDAVPIAVAVARLVPTFTAMCVRGGGRGGVERGRVALRGAVLVAQTNTLSRDLDEETSARVVAVAEAVRLASRVVDTPPAAMDPDALVGEAAAVAAELAGPTFGLDVAFDALRYDALAIGFGGLVAVGDAAARDGREPRCARQVPAARRGGGGAVGEEDCAVGKGITYDTGGLQIKGKSNAGDEDGHGRSRRRPRRVQGALPAPPPPRRASPRAVHRRERGGTRRVSSRRRRRAPLGSNRGS